jgi:hypothetical protein
MNELTSIEDLDNILSRRVVEFTTDVRLLYFSNTIRTKFKAARPQAAAPEPLWPTLYWLVPAYVTISSKPCSIVLQTIEEMLRTRETGITAELIRDKGRRMGRLSCRSGCDGLVEGV